MSRPKTRVFIQSKSTKIRFRVETCRWGEVFVSRLNSNRLTVFTSSHLLDEVHGTPQQVPRARTVVPELFVEEGKT